MLIQRSNLSDMWAGVALSIADMSLEEPSTDESPTDVRVAAEAQVEPAIPAHLDDGPRENRPKPQELAATLAGVGLNLPVTHLAARLSQAPIHLM